MLAAIDAMASELASWTICPASREAAIARSSAGLAVDQSPCSTARNPRMKYDQPSVAGLPGPDASSSSSQRTPSVVARVIQNHDSEVAS